MVRLRRSKWFEASAGAEVTTTRRASLVSVVRVEGGIVGGMIWSQGTNDIKTKVQTVVVDSRLRL
jgi:hypothetical protein